MLPVLRNTTLTRLGYRWASMFSWRRKKPGDDEAALEEVSKRSMDSQLDKQGLKMTYNQLAKHGKLTNKRSYEPPSNIKDIVGQTLKNFTTASDGDWQEQSLADPYVKYKVLSYLVEELNHDIPASVLTEMKTGENVLDYFSTPVKQTSRFEDMAYLNLPKNLHINYEPVRFSPETDTMFNGRTAFPGRNTIITSIKFRRKYKDIITTKEKAGYVNHYEGW